MVSNELNEAVIIAEHRYKKLLDYKISQLNKLQGDTKKAHVYKLVSEEIRVLQKFYDVLWELIKSLTVINSIATEKPDINTHAAYDAYLNKYWYNIKKTH